MSQNTVAEGSFQNPRVNEHLLNDVIAYFREESASHPFEAVQTVSSQRDVPRRTVREAVRKLRMNNRLVPEYPFVGELTLASENEDE